MISEAGARLARYETQLPGVVAGWRWEPVVKAPISLRGAALLTAAMLVAELGDLHRFATAGQLMGFPGLVPSEATTGDMRRQGELTKTGNGLALIEAAWNYRSPAADQPHGAGPAGRPKAVAEAAGVGYPHDIKGLAIYAYVTLKTGIPATDQIHKEINLKVREILGPHAVPEKIQFTEGLPKTRSGKIMRRILRQIAEDETDNLGDISTLADPAVVESLVKGRV